jgi:hypothetical protein
MMLPAETRSVLLRYVAHVAEKPLPADSVVRRERFEFVARTDFREGSSRTGEWHGASLPAASRAQR